MKKILLLILAISLCLGFVSCGGSDDVDTDGVSEESTSDTPLDQKKEPNKIVTRAYSFDTTTCDLAELIGGSNHQVSKDGQKLNSATVKLEVGTNIFDVVYTVSGIERTCEARIARRDGHRVIFNTNGGSYMETQYVEDAATINDAAVTPRRDRYTFAGWYNQKGEKVTLANTPIVGDTTFIAHWNGPNEFEMPNKTPVEYDTSSAALNINWKDYADAFGYRPVEIMCTLKNIQTNVSYTVRVTKYSASFVGASPVGASISKGAGNWTVKITGLPKNSEYSFLMDDLNNSMYTTIQSGTTVTNTLDRYEAVYDDSSVLMTENGRFYDVAGNVVVLKGVVPWNVNSSNFAQNTSTGALKRLQNEGCNVIRVTMPLGDSAGYGTPGKKEGYLNNMKGAVQRASDLGMYCIVDWGVMMKNGDHLPEAGYLDKWLNPAKEFFGIMSTEYKDNPYMILELANEPTVSATNAWEIYLRPWEESLIRHIRGIDPDATILASPNMHARRLSDDSAAKGDDPIDKPFPTEISYNLGFNFHCYTYTTTYNMDYNSTYRSDSVYGWRLCDAVKNGLTVVITEFSPANASMSSTQPFDSIGLDADFIEADKWMNFMLENDLNYTMFRYGDVPASSTTIQAQFMFRDGYEKDINKGTWTYDMLTACGKWYYDSALNTTGFIKAADFSASYKYQ